MVAGVLNHRVEARLPGRGLRPVTRSLANCFGAEPREPINPSTVR